MELRQLEYFLMVSDLASFTRAAERLYVSQPAVTNAVRSLEEELGIQLLDRSQRKVTLTAEGKIFYRHIQNIMQGISTTLNEINDLKSHNRGHLTIGVTPLAGITSTSRLRQSSAPPTPISASGLQNTTLDNCSNCCTRTSSTLPLYSI